MTTSKSYLYFLIKGDVSELVDERDLGLSRAFAGTAPMLKGQTHRDR
jgi:hypothetical protein